MDEYSSHSLRGWGPGAQGSLKDEGMDHSPGKPLRPRGVLAEGEGNLECEGEEGNNASFTYATFINYGSGGCSLSN